VRIRWPRRAKRPAPAPAAPVVEYFSWAPGRQPWLPGGTYVGTQGWTSRVSRDEAMSVPAVVRGRNLICAVASLPLQVLDEDNHVKRSRLLKQIDQNVPNVVTLAQTLDDLIFEAVAWWEITAYDWTGFPAHARHLDVDTVSLHPPTGTLVQTLPSGLYPNGVVWVMGKATDARNIIRFDSPNDPLLVDGARAIRRAIKLAQAGEMYADDPEARAYWRPAGEADPGDGNVIREWLKEFMRARRGGAEGYIPAALVREVPSAPSAVDAQLAELQARSDMEIANLLGIDPEDLGINTTSRTYNNATDRRVDRLNTVLAPFMRAITDRLSLNDFTRRGQSIAFDLDDYLKADPATRWANYATALDKNVMSPEEIRAKEGLPPGAPKQKPAPAAAPAPTNGSPVQQNTAVREVVSLSALPGETVTVSFIGNDAAEFAASKEKRTISGTVLPFGVQTSDARKLTFAPGSVVWAKAAVSRVKLDREHDASQLLGSATAITSSDSALVGKFRIARTPAGDEALTLAEDGALDGLSAIVEILEAVPDPAHEGGLLVTHARLRRVTLTADPAFADARVTTVAASASNEGTPTMGNTAPVPAAPPAPAAEPDVDAFTAAVEAFTAAVQSLTEMRIPAEQRGSVPAVTSVREPLVYSLTGIGHSFTRDAWDTRNAGYGSQKAREAQARLDKYSEQTAQLAAIATAREVQLANAGNTTDQADIIPPGYRPDLYVGQIPQGRPLFNSIGTRIALADATPFKVPYFVGSAGLSGTNTEGTGPSTGTITDHDYRTVTPTAQSGEFVVTRELMDSSNPAIDVIALNAMREEYSQDTEALIAAHIAAYTDDGSPAHLTSDTSTEGCYVYTVTGTGNDLYIDGIRFLEGEYPSHRFLIPDRMLASPTGYGALLRAIDDVGRPMFPFSSPSNAGGTTGRAAGSLVVDGMNVPQAWSMTSTYDDIVAFSSPDILVGESPMLTFKFFEKGGPENIYLNIWAYFAVQILRPAGIHAINYTAA
jgi:HK97 family phage prohead protease